MLVEWVLLFGQNFIKDSKMFAINWLFDKLGYMPKIDMEVGKVDLKLQDTWPFPVEEVAKEKKVIVPKATTRKPRATKKPAVVAKTARTKKSK